LIQNFCCACLLIPYLYGITSVRKLVEELRMHLAWRWLTGLDFDQEIPHHPGVEAVRATVGRDRSAAWGLDW
jgi:transposase